MIVSNVTPAMKMDLSLDLTGGTELIEGTIVSSGSWTSVVQAVRSLAGYDGVVPGLGNYTMVIPGNSTNAANVPAGDGIIWVTVADKGVVTAVGSLADGTAVNQKSGISKYGQWPMYFPVYGNGANGLLLTWVTFTNSATTAIDESVAVWIKKSAAAGDYYGSGFSVSPTPMASTFEAWDGMRTTNATVVLGGGNLTTPITNNVTVWYNTITVDPAATNNLTLSIDPGNGYITGSFTDPARNATNQIYGIMLQQTNMARGYFLGNNQSGYFLMK